jgi:molybdate transport system regulatory protein
MFRDKPGWSVGFRLWIQRGGRPVLGPGRVELLEEIERRHSIRAAAAHLGMSYRKAWGLVRSINEAAGEPLVELATGGRGGGGANLTKLGREAISLFRSLSEKIEHTTARASK